MLGSAAIGRTAIGALQSSDDTSEASPFQDLLQNLHKQRMYLLEIDAYDTTNNKAVTDYYATQPYITGPSESPANQAHRPSLDRPLRAQISMGRGEDLGGRANATAGRIEILSGDGRLDNRLPPDRAYDGRKARVFAGQSGFARADFGKVFEGTIKGVEYGRSTLIFRFRDVRARLGVQVQQNTYAGTGGLEGGSDLEGRAKPLCYGAAYNIEPVQVDESKQIWQVHDGPIDQVLNVRDAGVGLKNQGEVNDIENTAPSSGFNWESTSSGSYFRLANAPSGAVRADVRGDADGGYVNTHADVIDRIVRTRLDFTDSDIDGGSFDVVNAQVPGVMGIYLPESEPAESVIDRIVNSFFGFYGIDRIGRLRIGTIRLPVSPRRSYDDKRIENIRRRRTPVPVFARQASYQRNFAPLRESELASSATNRTAQTQEFLTTGLKEDSGIKTAHKLARGPLTHETLFRDKADAEELRDKIFNQQKVERDVYEVTLSQPPFYLRLGDVINLSSGRFGLDKDMLIISIREDARRNNTSVEVWG